MQNGFGLQDAGPRNDRDGHQKRKSGRLAQKNILEAQALLSRIVVLLDGERKASERSIMHKEPTVDWGDAGDMARLVEYLKDAESLLLKRSASGSAKPPSEAFGI